MCVWLVWAFSAAVGLVALRLLFAGDPEPVFGKYRVPGPRFWLKYLVMRLLLWLRKVGAAHQLRT